MMTIKFKNLEKSDLIREKVQSRVSAMIDKFPDLKSGKIQVTVEMENSPIQAGPDLFKVRIHVAGGRYRNITIEKGHLNLYHALAEVVDDMLEVLNRFGDKARVKERRFARKIEKEAEKRLKENERELDSQ